MAAKQQHAALDPEDQRLLDEALAAKKFKRKDHEGKIWYFRVSTKKYISALKPADLMAAVREDMPQKVTVASPKSQKSADDASPKAESCRSCGKELPDLRDEETVARERAQELAELQHQVLCLEERRDTLSGTIELLEAPVLAEARAVRDLRRRIALAEATLKKVKQENVEAREQHEARRRLLAQRVADLGKEIRLQQDDRADQEEQLQQLKKERQEMLREIDEERQKNADLELELTQALRRTDEARQRQRRLEDQARATGTLLREVTTSAHDVQLQLQTMRAGCNELQGTAERIRKQVDDARATLASKGDHSELRKEYEQKLRVWSSLEAPARMQEDAEFLRRESRNLRHNLERAQEEARALRGAAALLRSETERAEVTAAGLRRENAVLARITSELQHDAQRLLEEEEEALGEEGEEDEEDEEDFDDDSWPDEVRSGQGTATLQSGEQQPASGGVTSARYLAALSEYRRHLQEP
eukprot:TRINITY_DN6463_c0_g1_i1.p1 TRINITY_DN6463_c0_g1~~TRINITY_DN6463_c0_g1_i1.p1  ORF type:complete len:509 (+),score=222.53 TRINITY_DN6463_c0_g1_i1:102-1529(+)